MPHFERAPVARAEVLIHAPVQDAFDAFVEPELLTKFWLAKASGPLAAGRRVRWEFMVPGAADDLEVKVLEVNERIVLAWSDGTTSAWTFRATSPTSTVVTVTQAGFTGSGDDVVAQALDATQGYTLVLSDLKVLLEQGRSANLVRDKAQLIIDRR